MNIRFQTLKAYTEAQNNQHKEIPCDRCKDNHVQVEKENFQDSFIALEDEPSVAGYKYN